MTVEFSSGNATDMIPVLSSDNDGNVTVISDPMIATDNDTKSKVKSEVENTARRGRPRPSEAIDRDNLVLSAIRGAMTRDQIASIIEIKPSLVYLSLLRLRKTGQVTHTRNGATHLWSISTDSDNVSDDANISAENELIISEDTSSSVPSLDL